MFPKPFTKIEAYDCIKELKIFLMRNRESELILRPYLMMFFNRSSHEERIH